jgi:hypothetical protein
MIDSGRPLTRQNINDLKTTEDSNTLIVQRLGEYVQNLGLEIANINQSDRYFLVSSYPDSSPVTASELHLYVLLVVLELENNGCQEGRLVQLLSSLDIFKDVVEYLKKQRIQGYIQKEKTDDDTTIWRLGWRFYIEFTSQLPFRDT